MSNTIIFLNYKQDSFKAKLKALYDDLEMSDIHLSEDTSEKTAFFRKAQGRFVRIFREKNRALPIEIAERLKLSPKEYLNLEDGIVTFEDGLFFRIAHILKATNEASVFLEKIEETFKPMLRKGRLDVSQTLKQHGYTFADSDKYESSSRGQVIHFSSYQQGQYQGERL